MMVYVVTAEQLQMRRSSALNPQNGTNRSVIVFAWSVGRKAFLRKRTEIAI